MTGPARATTRARTTFVLAWCLALLSASVGLAAEPHQPVKAGKALYLSGGSGLSPPIRIVVNGTPVLRSQKAFACAACHSTEGQGSAESGIRVPPIDWRTLTATRPSRPAYDRFAIIRAVRSGIDSSGAALDRAMPRYDLDDRQAAALTYYLQILGTASDTDPGITPDEIKLGTVLPMSGPLADAGAAIAAALQARFAEVNAAGGIYGRRVTLVVADSGGELARTGAELRRLIENDGVFAIVGSLLAHDDQTLNALIADDNVPVIGPIAPSPTEAEARTSGVWHLLPTFHDQARVLVDAVHSARQGPFHAALVSVDTAPARDATAGARRQLEAAGVPPVLEIMVDPVRDASAAIAERIHDAHATWVFFFGDTQQLEDFAGALAALPGHARPELGGLAALSPAPHLPPSMSVTLAAAIEPPEGSRLRTLAASLERTGRPAGKPALQAIAYAGASVLVEGITRAGRQLGRASRIRELGLLRRFDTGVMPSVSFAPNRSVGVRGALILRVYDQGASYVPLGGFRSPAE